jgi:hypothetical protein
MKTTSPRIKRINIAYWIVTALFCAFMVFSSFGGLKLQKQAVDLMNVHLGYPLYFIQWISVAKIIGAVAILLPFVPARLKDLAYFGFFIDLATAVFSFIAVGDRMADWWPMLLFIAFLLLAYWLHRKRLQPIS